MIGSFDVRAPLSSATMRHGRDRAGDDRKAGPAPVRGHRPVRGQGSAGGRQPMPPDRAGVPIPGLRRGPHPPSGTAHRPDSRR